MTKTFSVKSNCTRAARKAFPAGDFEVYPVGNEWAFRAIVAPTPAKGVVPTTAVPVAKAGTSTMASIELASKPAKAEVDLHETFRLAYGHFNMTLFDGRLPECFILLHRKKGARGYFWAEQWKNKTSAEGRHEIAMNPNNFGDRDTKDILSTLVHEMTHLEQQVFGAPAKAAGYHNNDWVKLMDAVGLMAYDVKKAAPQIVDGVVERPKSQTGTKVSHVVIPGGAFDLSCDTLLSTGLNIGWTTHEASEKDKALAKKKKASKTKFTCPCCGQNAWAKPDASLGCWECGEEMEDAGE